MKYLKKYKIFEEARVLGTSQRVLPTVIKNDGSVANGVTGHIINVEWSRTTQRKPDADERNTGYKEIIVDDKWDYKNTPEQNAEHEYIGGVDSNGYLVGFNWNGNTLLNFQNNVVTKPGGGNWVRTKSPQQTEIPSVPEHPELSPNEGTGWVNVKIDRETINKVKRYSSNLTTKTGLTGFRERLKKLQNPVGIRGYGAYSTGGSNFTETTQQKISSLMILKYLQEIKDQFNPTSSGFLFESFVGGLINGTVPDDNSKCDVIGEDGSTLYQIKFNNWMGDKGTIKVIKTRLIEIPDEDRSVSMTHIQELAEARQRNFRDNNNPVDPYKNPFCDHYVMALKQHAKVYIYILSSRLPDTNKNSLGYYLENSGVSLSKLKSSNIGYELDLSKIDDNIEAIGNNLKEILNNIWTNISEIEYNVESITTGFDKNNSPIDEDDYDDLFKNSTDRLKVIDVEIKKLRKPFKLPGYSSN